MKINLQKFMNSKLYIITVYLFFFVVWLLKYVLDSTILLDVTLISYIFVSIVVLLILRFFDDIYYLLPFLFGFMFSFGYDDLTIDTISSLTYGIIALVILLTGIIIHVVKYPFKVKITLFLLSYMLAAISFFIPALYIEYSILTWIMSLSGLLYVLLIIIYQKLSKNRNSNDLMRILLFTSLFLLLELFTLIIVEFALANGSINDRFIFVLNRNFELGWSNINDLTILLVLFSSSIIYYVFKYPKKLIFPLLLMFEVILIYISFARGSMLTIILLVLIVSFYVLFAKTDKYIKRNVLICWIIIVVIMLINFDITKLTFNSIINNLVNKDRILTGRPTLWKKGLETFKAYPFFGASWVSGIDQSNRIIVYHSTILHVMAISGVFGLLILIFNFYSIYKIFVSIKDKHIRYPLLLSFLLTQIHGLLDNTQYMIFYSVAIITIFSFFPQKDLLNKDELLIS